VATPSLACCVDACLKHEAVDFERRMTVAWPTELHAMLGRLTVTVAVQPHLLPPSLSMQHKLAI